MWLYKAVARIFFALSLVNFTLAGVAQSLEAPVYLAQVAKDTTKALNPGILPANLDRTPVNPPPEPAPTTAPDDGKFYNEELRQKIQDYIVLATVEGSVMIPTAEGAQKDDQGVVSPGASTVVYRDLITRAFAVSQTLNDHLQGQEDLLSRSLANLRDEVLRFLIALSRRLIEELD